MLTEKEQKNRERIGKYSDDDVKRIIVDGFNRALKLGHFALVMGHYNRIERKKIVRIRDFKTGDTAADLVYTAFCDSSGRWYTMGGLRLGCVDDEQKYSELFMKFKASDLIERERSSIKAFFHRNGRAVD